MKPEFDATGWFVLILLATFVILAFIAAILDGFMTQEKIEIKNIL
jgi:hypothetical protein